MNCRACGTPLPLDADPRAIYCSGACRARAYRARCARSTSREHAALTEALAAAESGARPPDLLAILRGALRAS